VPQMCPAANSLSRCALRCMQAEPEIVPKTSPRLWHGTVNKVCQQTAATQRTCHSCACKQRTIVRSQHVIVQGSTAGCGLMSRPVQPNLLPIEAPLTLPRPAHVMVKPVAASCLGLS
jgi:hypothetical protein